MKLISISFYFIFAILSCTAEYFYYDFYLQNLGFYKSITPCYCLTIDSTSAHGLALNTCEAGQEMRQNFGRTKRDATTIEFLANANFLNLAGGSNVGDPGRPILNYPFVEGEGSNQYWYVEKHSDGGYTIRNLLTNGYLSVDPSDKTNVSQAAQVTGPYQRWYVADWPSCPDYGWDNI